MLKLHFDADSQPCIEYSIPVPGQQEKKTWFSFPLFSYVSWEGQANFTSIFGCPNVIITLDYDCLPVAANIKMFA